MTINVIEGEIATSPTRTSAPTRRLRALFVAVTAAVVLAGCGGGGETSTPTSEIDSASTFPVNVTHAHGTVTIESAPARVVTLGSADTQIASALGANIVGAVRNPSSVDGNWTGTALPDAVLVLDSTKPNIEAIAAFTPDVILATTAQAEYDKSYDVLSRIAPVVSYKTALLQDSGEELTELIGSALGKGEQARALTAQSDEAIGQFRTTHDSLEGKTYAYGQYAGGTLYLLGQPTNPSAKFLSRLGLKVADEVASAATADPTSAFVKFSPENFGILDSADVALISTYGEGSEEEFRGLPTVASLALTVRGNLQVIDQELSSALLFPNPATTEFLLGRLTPILVALDRGE